MVRPKHVARQECVDCYRKEACAQNQVAAADARSLQSLACSWSCPLMDRACRSQCEAQLGPQPAANEANAAMTKCRTNCGEGSDWNCIGRSKYATGSKIAEVPFHVVLLASASREPLAGVTLRPCADPGCMILAGKTCTSDDNGHCGGALALTNSGSGPSFAGVIEATGTEVYPTLYFVHPPIAGEWAGSPAFTPNIAFGMTKSTFTVGAALAGVEPIAGRAHLLVTLMDCLWAGADGLVLTVSNSDDKTAVRYTAGTFLAPDAKATDSSGIALAFNLPASSTSVTLRAMRAEEVVVETLVYLRADTLSFGSVGPR